MALFENLTARLSRTVDTLRGRGRITEENIRDTMRTIRMALLEADVALPVVRDFIAKATEAATLASASTTRLAPSQLSGLESSASRILAVRFPALAAARIL